MDAKEAREFVESKWEESIKRTLCDYISIPNQSPLFDAEWNSNGYQERAVELLVDWVKSQNVDGLSIDVITEPNRTPLIFIEIDGDKKTAETILMYGHLDKQPPMEADWSSDLGPWKPVIKDGKLYGRGGADDGYSVFAAVTSIAALKAQNQPHARIVIVIEACEESGSPDLPFYVDKLSDQIGTPSLVVCLDSGCGNYEQFWLTTSLRGIAVGNLKVSVSTEAVHSGLGSGIVPGTFRILTELLRRVEDPQTGQLLVPECFCDIPDKHVKYAADAAATLGKDVWQHFPFLQGVKPMHDDEKELLLNRNWRPTCTVTGASGLPSLGSAGNVMRTQTTVKLSIRLPPAVNSRAAIEAVKRVLEADPPYGAHVEFNIEKCANGWAAPEMEAWLEEAVNNASISAFNLPARFMGEGGSIPFMGMLGEKFPGVQFVITGLLGPKSNAHGPNEFMHIDMMKGVTVCVASVVSEHWKRKCAGGDMKRRKA